MMKQARFTRCSPGDGSQYNPGEMTHDTTFACF
jgi:hypothetical protein